jgi:hypothetical protein
MLLASRLTDCALPGVLLALDTPEEWMAYSGGGVLSFSLDAH